MTFFPDAPVQEQMLFDPDLFVEVETGAAWVRREGARELEQLGTGGSGECTSGFAVWVGRWVLALGDGVAAEARGRVADSLRAQLAFPELPIVYVRGFESGKRLIAHSEPANATPYELAKAAGYVVVQASWYEEPTLIVELDGAPIELTVEFVPLSTPGHYAPQVT